MEMKVYIAPSTQENNKTALGQTEEYVMHLIADKFVPLLEDMDFKVYRGRKDQTAAQMVAEANTLGCDFYLSIHSNAANGKSRGCEVWYYTTSEKGKALAQAVYNELAAITPTTDRGIKPSTKFIELKNTKMPAIIAEVDFHDNFEGALWIRDNVRAIAEAYAKGFCKHVGVEFKKNIYRQQIQDIRGILGC